MQDFSSPHVAFCREDSDVNNINELRWSINGNLSL